MISTTTSAAAQGKHQGMLAAADSASQAQTAKLSPLNIAALAEQLSAQAGMPSPGSGAQQQQQQQHKAGVKPSDRYCTYSSWSYSNVQVPGSPDDDQSPDLRCNAKESMEEAILDADILPSPRLLRYCHNA